MEITNQKFYDLFNSGTFGGTIETIVAIRQMEKAEVIKLSDFQKSKLNEYFDRAILAK